MPNTHHHTTAWHVNAMSRCLIDPPVMHSVQSLSDTLSCSERGKREDFCRLAFSGASRDVHCQAEEQQQLGSLSFFQPPFLHLMNGPRRSCHWSFPHKGSMRLTCLSRFFLPTAIEIAIAEVKLTRNLVTPLCTGLAGAGSREPPAFQEHGFGSGMNQVLEARTVT